MGLPMIPTLVAAVYGDGDSSILVKYADKLTSTITEGPRAREPEVTPLIVAMALTAVR